MSGCSWTAASNAAWIALASGRTGDGPGTVTLTVAANTGTDRSGTVTVAGQTYTISQAAPAPTPAPPTPTPPPTPPPSPDPGPPPTPTPPPSPPPDPDQTTHVDGRVGLVWGSCPDINFLVKLTVVVADATTDYKHGSCDDVRRDADVKVTGTTGRDLKVHASSIDVKGGHDQ
jgi:hypothetical protein